MSTSTATHIHATWNRGAETAGADSSQSTLAMEQVASLNPDDSLAPAPKRRKLRKGTSSCWECKRRKARCSFSTADGAIDGVCHGCKLRGTPCIPQDLPDQPAPGGSNRHLVDRLAQVEALVGRLVQAADQNQQGDSSSSPPKRLQQPSLPAVIGDEIPPFLADYPFLFPPDYSGIETSLFTAREEQSHVHTTRPSITQTTIAVSAKEDAPSTENSVTSPGKYDSVCRELLSVWPAARDMEIILGAPVHTSAMMRGANLTRPVNVNLPEMELPSPETLLELPSPSSHPVLIARKLLLLATFLQGIPPASWEHLGNLRVSRQELMIGAVSKAHHLVTSNDELVASIEGIECLMLEGLYESYSGSLRPSWLATRRAVTIAQMLGLHRGARPTSLRSATFKPDHVWFRLVQLDRYLSIMLGLPPISVDDSFAKPDILDTCTPEERMQRLNCAAAGHILRRTPTDALDPAKTKEIDKLLQDSSASLPPQWWLTPTLSSSHGQMDTIRDTLRFNGHFMHYHMLLHLHLPYLLPLESSRDYEYSRMAAISASREILSRIASFRTFRPTGYYCRGVDLLAFLACTALGLAHICDHGRRSTGDGEFPFLVHQRLSDRGLLQHTLQYMSDMARINDDAIGLMVATLLEHLLAIEEDAAAGSSYIVTSCMDSDIDREEGTGGSHFKLSPDGSVLTIHLPHIWVVKIERGPGQSGRLPTKTSRTSNSASQPAESTTQPRPTSNQAREVHQSKLPDSTFLQNPCLAQLMPFVTRDHLAKASQGTEDGSLGFLLPIQELNENEGVVEDIDVSFFNSFIQEMPV
ncbi:unnamed protein product [Clonostachys byssicola]|uniref:Zn(2)-C6 fungal-type domain-containing protein n=1 Tax=Clonostachys byssicola TaxID=160290 RepID=A0A9N9UYE0_9HYPO|nr:unnamed protein product [Clonostachys byssicola]